jgi:hypothetical protein
VKALSDKAFRRKQRSVAGHIYGGSEKMLMQKY